MGGTCAIGIHLASDGVIHHADALQKITFGDRADGVKRGAVRGSVRALAGLTIGLVKNDPTLQVS